MRKLTLTGNIGADAVIRANNATGENFATFSIGTTINNKTYWTKITASAKFTSRFPFLNKGCKVLIEGFPITNAYINKDGVLIAELVCHATSIELLAKPPVHEEHDANQETEFDDTAPF